MADLPLTIPTVPTVGAVPHLQALHLIAVVSSYDSAAHWLQLQTMGTGNSWITVFSGLGVIGLASLCAIYIPSAHPCSEVQYVGLLSSLSD